MKDIYGVIITGSREWGGSKYFDVMKGVIKDLKALYGVNLLIIHGGCRGADLMAQYICLNLQINCLNIPAKWDIHGKAAGPIRNQEMLDVLGSDLVKDVMAFHDNLSTSVGTRDMVTRALRLQKIINVFDQNGFVKRINPKQLELF